MVQHTADMTAPHETDRECLEIASNNPWFMEIVNDEHNPMTNRNLEMLLERHPERYAKFKPFIGKLKS